MTTALTEMTCQWASWTVQRTAGLSAVAPPRSRAIVKTLLNQLPKRLRRIQASGSRLNRGGPIIPMSGRLAEAILALHDPQPGVDDVHDCRYHQADDEVSEHHHGDRLYGLTGLAEDHLAHCVQVRESDRDGQARVLGQVQVLIRQGRDNYPQGLRQDHETQDLQFAQPDCPGRLELPVRYGQQSGPDNVGDKGARVQHQAEEDAGKLGGEACAPHHAQASGCGQSDPQVEPFAWDEAWKPDPPLAEDDRSQDNPVSQ